MSLRKMFEMLNRINKTPSFSKMDAKIKHNERINAVLTRENGKKKKI